MKKGMKYEHLVPEWKELYESGWSFREIGRKYGIDNKTVNRTLSPHIEKRRIDKWFAYADEWYNLFVNYGYSKSDIAKKYDTNISQVSKVLVTKGIPTQKRETKKYEHLISIWVKEYKNGDSLQMIAKRHGVNRQTVLNYLNEEDIEIRSLSEAKREMELDEHYFDELTKEKAYHLGLLFSVGSALELHNSYVIQISAGQSRKYLLDPLTQVLRGEMVGVYIGSDGVHRIRFASKYFYEHLKSMGLLSKEKAKFPVIRNELLTSFIYGYFEGASENQPSKGHFGVEGSLFFLKRLKEELTKMIHTKNIVLKKKNGEEKYRLEIDNRDTIRELKQYFLINTDFELFHHTTEKTWLLNEVEYEDT